MATCPYLKKAISGDDLVCPETSIPTDFSRCVLCLTLLRYDHFLNTPRHEVISAKLPS